ncbi:MAG: ROK family protein [Streptosporangiaceae bacterium]
MTRPDLHSAVTDEHLDSLVTVLDLIRSHRARTRPALQHASGYGRAVVTQRVLQLIGCGLIEEGRLGPSTGGRAPRELSLRSSAGHLLVAALGATSISTGLADLSGNLLSHHEEPNDVAVGPEHTMHRVEELFDKMLSAAPHKRDVWGVGIGLPAPVEFSAGRSVSPPIMPGWDGYPVGQRLATRYQAPAWVDNDVNLMALGELRAGLAQNQADIVYIKVGTGIGAGLISAGRLHRGAQGAAGDVGHVAVGGFESVICRCGNAGCLEAIAGGGAIARDATAAARDGRTPFLAARLGERETLTVRDVIEASGHGDVVAVDLLNRSGDLVGSMMAAIVNFCNPSLVIIGGGVASAGDMYLANIRQTVYSRSLPLATRDLRIVRSSNIETIGLLGAAHVVLDELFSRDRLGRWINEGTPAGRPELSRAE